MTYNSAPVLPDFLSSLRHAVSEVESVQVLAADNASADTTTSLLEASQVPIRILPSASNDGYAAGINRALAQADPADAYLVLNPDVRLTPGAITKLLRALSTSGVGISVPRLLRPDGTLVRSQRREPSLRRAWAELLITGERAARTGTLGELVGDEAAYLESRAVSWASGAAMMISAECLRVVGPWDERFFLYSEETDYCLRARDAGQRTFFCADATILHVGGEAKVSPSLYAIQTLNRVRVYRKRHGRAATGLYGLAILTKQILRSLRRDPTAQAAVRALLVPRTRHPELRRMSARSLARSA